MLVHLTKLKSEIKKAYATKKKNINAWKDVNASAQEIDVLFRINSEQLEALEIVKKLAKKHNCN